MIERIVPVKSSTRFFILSALLAILGCFVAWWFGGGFNPYPFRGIEVSLKLHPFVFNRSIQDLQPLTDNTVTIYDVGGLVPLVLTVIAIVLRFRSIWSKDRHRDYLTATLLGLIAYMLIHITIRIAQLLSLRCVECPMLGPGMFMILLGGLGMLLTSHRQIRHHLTWINHETKSQIAIAADSTLPPLTYNADGLVPAIVQHYQTGDVLMLAYMNPESLRLTLETGETHFWSRSRAELWHKGATSGNTQRVVSIHVDCDADTLLIRVDPAGPACHTGQPTCFFRTWDEYRAHPEEMK